MRPHPYIACALLCVAPVVAAQTTVGAGKAATVIGKGATVCGKVESFRVLESSEGQPTLLHLGGAFPRHTFTVRINRDNRQRFEAPPESMVGEMICVTGAVSFATGNVPEMEIRKPAELTRM